MVLMENDRPAHTIAGYEIGDTALGEGDAEIRIARRLHTGENVAVKIIAKAFRLEAEKKSILREISVLQTLNQRGGDAHHIITFHHFAEDDNYYYIFMELLGEDLLKRVIRETKIEEANAAGLFLQMVTAIAFCHSCSITHGDVKLENFVFDCNGQQLKLIDFGGSYVLHPSKRLRSSAFRGSPAYCPPEIIKGQSYSGTAADIWGLGICLFTMLTGCFPFYHRDGTALQRRIVEDPLRFPSHISTVAQSLLRRLLTKSPSRRATLEEVRNHPWLAPQSMCPVSSMVSPTSPCIEKPAG